MTFAATMNLLFSIFEKLTIVRVEKEKDEASFSINQFLCIILYHR